MMLSCFLLSFVCFHRFLSLVCCSSPAVRRLFTACCLFAICLPFDVFRFTCWLLSVTAVVCLLSCVSPSNCFYLVVLSVALWLVCRLLSTCCLWCPFLLLDPHCCRVCIFYELRRTVRWRNQRRRRKKPPWWSRRPKASRRPRNTRSKSQGVSESAKKPRPGRRKRLSGLSGQPPH